jgi:hypothetical protein
MEEMDVSDEEEVIQKVSIFLTCLTFILILKTMMVKKLKVGISENRLSIMIKLFKMNGSLSVEN